MSPARVRDIVGVLTAQICHKCLKYLSGCISLSISTLYMAASYSSIVCWNSSAATQACRKHRAQGRCTVPPKCLF